MKCFVKRKKQIDVLECATKESWEKGEMRGWLRK
jgi:hypothetical protein